MCKPTAGQNRDATECGGPPWSKISHLARSRLGYEYPGLWLQVPEWMLGVLLGINRSLQEARMNLLPLHCSHWEWGYNSSFCLVP